MTIDVDAAQMHAAARGLAADTNSVSAGYDALHAAMGSIGGMAGSDPAAREWGAQFDSGLSTALSAHHDVIAALASCAELTDATATNHANADGQSVIGPKPLPEQLGISKTNLTPAPKSAPPKSAGDGGVGEPAWWRWIKDRVGDIWPNGHQDRLLAAGAALRKAAGTLDDAGSAMQPRIGTVKAQTSPEIDPAVSTLTAVQGGLRGIAGVYKQLAQACDDLAHHIDQVRSEMEEAAVELVGLTLLSFVPGLEELLAGVAARIMAIYERFRALLAVARVAMVGAEDAALVEARAMKPIADAVSKARSFSTVDKAALDMSAIAELSEAERAVAFSARNIFTSPEFAAIRTAHEEGKAVEVTINGTKVLYEPDLPASGFTLFGEHGFVIGPQAFTSESELAKTVAHESYRLATSQSAGGVSGPMATDETQAAFNFAEKTWKFVMGGS